MPHRTRAPDRLCYSGRHRHHRANRQGLTDPHGRLIWISDGLPGSTHDLTAARTHGVFAVADRAQLYLYADKGYTGGKGLTRLTPYKGRNLPDTYRQANRCHTAVRANGERGSAVLKTWKIFDRFRSCPRQVGTF
ncbi:MAG: transposase family protein, partial [Mycobacteriaceae bacterium]